MRKNPFVLTKLSCDIIYFGSEIYIVFLGVFNPSLTNLWLCGHKLKYLYFFQIEIMIWLVVLAGLVGRLQAGRRKSSHIVLISFIL
jgi:hypothetical protein